MQQAEALPAYSPVKASCVLLDPEQVGYSTARHLRPTLTSSQHQDVLRPDFFLGLYKSEAINVST